MTRGTTRFSAVARVIACSALPWGNALIGLSFGWWVPKHNAHHAHPNELGRDPRYRRGIRPRPRLTLRENSPAPLTSWLARWQAPLFFLPPHGCCEAPACTYSGSSGLPGGGTVASAVEGSLIMLHAAPVPDGGALGAPPPLKATRFSSSYSRRSSSL